MCGISGWIRPSGMRMDVVVAMTQKAAHRGPDGEAYWFWNGGSNTGELLGKNERRMDAKTGIAGLGHRRLAILDLSDRGLQPMSSPDKNLWLVFNGEIFNYIELKIELEKIGHHFLTQTDTEVILHAYLEWGARCFERMNGMWGLALVDLKKRKLILSRDRLGIKPLYVWQDAGQSIAFASEIKQFYALENFQPVTNMKVVREYIETGYETPEDTFFQNVHAFPAGCWSEIDLHNPIQLSPVNFWDIDKRSSRIKTADEAVAQLRELFSDAVRLCLRSDVSVGVSLSGGLDSTAIYSIIQLCRGLNSAETHAFSAVFGSEIFDERIYMEKAVKALGGRLHFTTVNPEDFIDDFDRFIYQHDEPPGSFSLYAAWKVMKLANQSNVPVLLNGQGGDELFSGYWPAYYLYLRRVLFKNPMIFLQHILGACLPGGNSMMLQVLAPHVDRYWYRKKKQGRQILKASLRQSPQTLNSDWASIAQTLEPAEYRMHEIRRVHLPRLLKWEDKNSMAFGIEGRYPFLDYRLVEFAVSLPVEMNFKSGWNKWLLRQSADFVPPEIRWRKAKVGFVTPQSEWILKRLKPAITELMEKPSAELRSIIDESRFKTFMAEYLGKKNIHVMDEKQILLVRLFFLNRWFQVFKPSIRESI